MARVLDLLPGRKRGKVSQPYIDPDGCLFAVPFGWRDALPIFRQHRSKILPGRRSGYRDSFDRAAGLPGNDSLHGANLWESNGGMSDSDMLRAPKRLVVRMFT